MTTTLKATFHGLMIYVPRKGSLQGNDPIEAMRILMPNAWMFTRRRPPYHHQIIPPHWCAVRTKTKYVSNINSPPPNSTPTSLFQKGNLSFRVFGGGLSPQGGDREELTIWTGKQNGGRIDWTDPSSVPAQLNLASRMDRVPLMENLCGVDVDPQFLTNYCSYELAARVRLFNGVIRQGRPLTPSCCPEGSGEVDEWQLKDPQGGIWHESQLAKEIWHTMSGTFDFIGLVFTTFPRGERSHIILGPKDGEIEFDVFNQEPHKVYDPDYDSSYSGCISDGVAGPNEWSYEQLYRCTKNPARYPIPYPVCKGVGPGGGGHPCTGVAGKSNPQA